MRLCAPLLSFALISAGCAQFLSESDPGDEPAPGDDVETRTFDTGIVDIDDTSISSTEPATAAGAALAVLWDRDTGGHRSSAETAALLRFVDLVGDDAEQIPPGAEIISATLYLTVSDPGDAGTLCDVLVPWQESTTWQTLGPSTGLDAGVDYDDANPVAALLATATGQVLELDVTRSVAGWASGDRANFGWLITPNGSDRAEVYSSEAAIDTRPELVVELRR